MPILVIKTSPHLVMLLLLLVLLVLLLLLLLLALLLLLLLALLLSPGRARCRAPRPNRIKWSWLGCASHTRETWGAMPAIRVRTEEMGVVVHRTTASAGWVGVCRLRRQ